MHEQEGFLVYEFMVNGNLARHLCGTNPDHDSVSWKRRLQICVGVACGLHCLQTGLKSCPWKLPQTIHKVSVILS
nr:receptor-like protein kinase theseus 1 [Quercus suber]